MVVALDGGTKYWKVLAKKHILERGVWAGSPWGRLLAGKTCAEDTTLTGTGNKLCETENERLNCTLFKLFAWEVDILVMVSTPQAFVLWRGRGPRGLSMRRWGPKGAVGWHKDALRHTFHRGDGIYIDFRARHRSLQKIDEEAIDLEGKDEVVGGWNCCCWGRQVWKLYRSLFIQDQLVRPDAAESYRKAVSEWSHFLPENWRAVSNIKSLYWVMSCHLDGWLQQKIHIYTVKASTHVTISEISRTLFLVDTSSFPSRYVWGSESWALTLSGSRSARSMNWLALNFLTSFSGMGEYPGPTTKGLCSKEVTKRAKVGVENMGEKNWLVVGSAPLATPWEPNNNGCERDKLPNVQ